jgi:hypothetical protein
MFTTCVQTVHYTHIGYIKNVISMAIIKMTMLYTCANIGSYEMFNWKKLVDSKSLI